MAERIFVRLGLRSAESGPVESVLLVPDSDAGWLPETEMVAGERARTVASWLASELLGREVDENEPLLWKSSSGFSSRSRGRFGTVLFALEVDPTEVVAPPAGAGWQRIQPEPEKPPSTSLIPRSVDLRIGGTYYVIGLGLGTGRSKADRDLISRNLAIRSVLGPPPDVRIFCDYCATLPVWGLDNPAACGLDRQLIADLVAWQQRWPEQPEPEFCDESGEVLPEHRQWWQEQRDPLTERVRRALGPGPIVTSHH